MIFVYKEKKSLGYFVCLKMPWANRPNIFDEETFLSGLDLGCLSSCLYSNMSLVSSSNTALAILARSWRGNCRAAAERGKTPKFAIAMAVHMALAMLDAEVKQRVLDLVPLADEVSVARSR